MAAGDANLYCNVQRYICLDTDFCTSCMLNAAVAHIVNCEAFTGICCSTTVAFTPDYADFRHKSQVVHKCTAVSPLVGQAFRRETSRIAFSCRVCV